MIDLGVALARVQELGRSRGEVGAATTSLLEQMGFRLAAPLAAAGAATLLVVGSRAQGTVTLYEIPDGASPELLADLAKVSGHSFSRLEELPAGDRAPAVRVLAATRQTGLGPDELASWLETASSPALVADDELAALDGVWADLMRAELTAGGPPSDVPPLAPFARAFAFVYDGT